MSDKSKTRIEFRPEEAQALLFLAWEHLKVKKELEEADHSLIGAFVKLCRGQRRLKPPMEAVGSQR